MCTMSASFVDHPGRGQSIVGVSGLTGVSDPTSRSDAEIVVVATNPSPVDAAELTLASLENSESQPLFSGGRHE